MGLVHSPRQEGPFNLTFEIIEICNADMSIRQTLILTFKQGKGRVDVHDHFVSEEERDAAQGLMNFFSEPESPVEAFGGFLQAIERSIPFDPKSTYFPDTLEYRRRRLVGKVQKVQVAITLPRDRFWSTLLKMVEPSGSSH